MELIWFRDCGVHYPRECGLQGMFECEEDGVVPQVILWGRETVGFKGLVQSTPFWCLGSGSGGTMSTREV